MFEFIGKLSAFLFTVIIGILISFLIAHIVLDIAHLYDIKFMSQFSFVQMYGIITLFGLLTIRNVMSITKLDNGKSFSDNMVDVVSKQFGITIAILLGWWVAYLVFYYLT